MRSIGFFAAILAITLALAGCKNRKEEPLPGPRANRPAAEAIQHYSVKPPRRAASGVAHPDGEHHHGASGISWFQGGVEEAFSCPGCTAMFWREALDR